MRQAKCASCGTTGPLNTSYLVNDVSYCEACANKAFADLKNQSAPIRVLQPVDPTVCARCGMDNGSSELQKTGAIPLCFSCSEAVRSVGLPGWLKTALAGLLALLAFALVHGKPYFAAGRSLVLAERLMAQKEYPTAIPHLESVLNVAPQSQKAILLSAKAYILTDRFSDARDVLGRRSELERGALTDEITALVDRLGRALNMADQAEKLEKEKKYKEAAETMRKAATLFPESAMLARAATYYEQGEAFERKDYDAFLNLTEQAWQRNPRSPQNTAALASALACKYAVTGDPSFKARSEKLLEESRIELQRSPELREWYDEYSERIRHRLASREIIDKDEFDRRFRQKKDDGKKD
jgi:tetratricopeptide (TPR) repeat protein